MSLFPPKKVVQKLGNSGNLLLYKNIYKDLVLCVMTLLCRASMVWSPALSQPTCGLVLSWSSTASSSSRALWKTSASPSPTLPSSPWPHCEWRPPCSCASCSPYTPSPPPSQRSPECGPSLQKFTEKWSHIQQHHHHPCHHHCENHQRSLTVTFSMGPPNIGSLLPPEPTTPCWYVFLGVSLIVTREKMLFVFLFKPAFRALPVEAWEEKEIKMLNLGSHALSLLSLSHHKTRSPN